MKKNNDGYALVLVLVVITVLCLVAMAMMAASLKNLQNQQRSIERMEAKYAAQGEIEKVIAGFEEKVNSSNGALANLILSETLENGGLYDQHTNVVCTSIEYSNVVDNDPASDHDFLLIYLEVSDDFETKSNRTIKTKINCTIKITGSIDTGIPGQYNVLLSGLKWEYVSYTITEGGGAE